MNIFPELTALLAELGLNRAETEAYLALLELGSGPASTIAAVAGLNRITAYEALKRLSKQGFVRIRAKKNSRTRYFTPVEYPEILEKLQQKQEKISETIRKATVLKNSFEAAFIRVEAKPVVLFYEGEDGIQEVLNATLKNNAKELLSFSSAESLDSTIDTEFLKKYWLRRTKRGIPARGIMAKTEKALADFNSERNKRELRKIRFVPPEIYKFKNEIDIWDDMVGIMSLPKGAQHGILIQSRSIAESLRAVFEALWHTHPQGEQ